MSLALRAKRKKLSELAKKEPATSTIKSDSESPVAAAVMAALKPNHSDGDGTGHAADIEALQAEYEVYAEAMKADLAQLNKIEEIPDKIEYKRKALELNDYVDFVERCAKAGWSVQNKVMKWTFIWLVDCEKWQDAIELLPTMIATGQRLPEEKFKDTSCWAAFTGNWLYKSADSLLQSGRDAIENSEIIAYLRKLDFIFNEHSGAIEQTNKTLIVHGSINAMLGKLENECFNYGKAFNHCYKAFDVNGSKAGVKTLMGTLAEKVGKVSPQA